jgi:hypothetical protein
MRGYRATVHRADGSTEDVPVVVPDGFFPATATEELHHYRGSGWQNTDDDHLPAGGHAGYRVAYKTLKIIPSQDISLEWPNLRVHFAVGKLNRGGIRTPEGVPGRRPDEHVVPEHGIRLVNASGSVRYVGCPDHRLTFAAWEESPGGLRFVEILYRLPDGSPSEPAAVLRAGRAAVASLKTILDLTFGPRLLGLPLLEEIGQVFDDWHWTRRLDSLALAAESQLPLVMMPSPEFVSRVQPRLQQYQEAGDDDRRRFRLASQWYWLADAEQDPTNRFIQYWLVLESLEMETADIAPVKARLAESLDEPVSRCGEFVGRLYGVRSRLVHGNSDRVTSEQLTQVQTLARLLLLRRAGEDHPDQEIRQLRAWIADGSR